MRAFSTLLPTIALVASVAAVPFKINGTGIAKRQEYDNVPFTWFDVGVGACGGTNQPNEYVVALDSALYDGGAHCWELINISAWGKSTQAAIVDECPGCAYGGLDLTTGLFDFFTWAGAAGSSTDPGVIYGEWSYA